MAFTSETLRKLTREKLGLIKEIDKTPSNNNLQEKLKLLELGIVKEQTILISRQNTIQEPTTAMPLAGSFSDPPRPRVGKSLSKKALPLLNSQFEKKLQDFF